MNGTKWMVWMENIIYRKNRKCEQSLSSGVEERRLLEDVAVRGRVENQEDQKIVFLLHFFFFGFCLLKKSHFFLSHPQKWRREYKRRKEGREERRNSYMSSVSLYNFYWSYFSRSFFPNNFFLSLSLQFLSYFLCKFSFSQHSLCRTFFFFFNSQLMRRMRETREENRERCKRTLRRSWWNEAKKRRGMKDEDPWVFSSFEFRVWTKREEDGRYSLEDESGEKCFSLGSEWKSVT